MAFRWGKATPSVPAHAPVPHAAAPASAHAGAPGGAAKPGVGQASQPGGATNLGGQAAQQAPGAAAAPRRSFGEAALDMAGGALRTTGGALGSTAGWLGHQAVDQFKGTAFQMMLMVVAALGAEQLLKRLAGEEEKKEEAKAAATKAETAKRAESEKPKAASVDRPWIDVGGRVGLQSQGAKVGFAGGRAEAGSGLRSGDWVEIGGPGAPSRGLLLKSGVDSVGLVERRDGNAPEKAIIVSREDRRDGIPHRRGATMDSDQFEVGVDGKITTQKHLDRDIGRAVDVSKAPLSKAEEIALVSVKQSLGKGTLPEGVVADPFVTSGLDIKAGKLTSQLVVAGVNGQSRSALFESGRVTLMQEERGEMKQRVIEDASIAPGRNGFGFNSAVGSELHGFMANGQAPGRSKVLEEARTLAAATPAAAPIQGGARITEGLAR